MPGSDTEAAIGVELAAVAATLRKGFGDDVEIVGARRIRPWSVARCELRGGDRDGAAMPPTVIVKWLRSNPEGFRVDRRQMATEEAALRFVADVVPGVAPALLAADLDWDFLVLEDLAPRRTLHSVLSSGLASTDIGVAGLHAFARAMGRLHAGTAGGPRTLAGGPWDESSRVLIPPAEAMALLDRLDEIVPVSAATRADVVAATNEIGDPGPFAAFSNGDSGANNCLVDAAAGDARLIDFEHACVRHALLDATALHVPGSMWMTVADPVPLGVEDTYRDVAGTGMPAVLDDPRYFEALAAACGVKALLKVERFEKLDAREPGHHSRRQMVSTLDRTVATMARARALGALASWLDDLAGALRRRWPDADVAVLDDYSLREPFAPDH